MQVWRKVHIFRVEMYQQQFGGRVRFQLVHYEAETVQFLNFTALEKRTAIPDPI